MSKSLVTGGAGFIGSHLVDELIKRGDEVTIIDNLFSGKKEYINEKAKFFELDINAKEVEDIFKENNFDFVFHLAAQIDVNKSVLDPVLDNQINALGSLHIFRLAAEAKVKKVIFISTGGALYGDCVAPATEENLVQPNSPYAIHKFAAERYLEMFRETHGLKSSVLRLANVYGPRQYKGGECGVVGIFTNNYLSKEKSYLYGDGTKTRDYVYVFDVVRAIVLASESQEESVFNVSSGKETSVGEIIHTIEKITNSVFDYEKKPDKLGEVQRSVLSYNRAQEYLGWQPTVDLDTGIRNLLAK